MFQEIKRRLSPYYRNLQGWRTDRKIVVIESDDWGSIRMPSKGVFKTCLKHGYRVDENPYERYDSLASEEDLELLFSVLTSFRDRSGNHPVITANAVVANPDFDKIKASGYRGYHYELIPETFRKYPSHKKCLNLWRQGCESGIFSIQSHGREHLNVSKFMGALRNQDRDVHFGFEMGMPGLVSRNRKKPGNKYVVAMRYSDDQDKEEKKRIAAESLELFESLFGFRSLTYIPQNYLWSPDFDSIMAEGGVIAYQGIRKMGEPIVNGSIRRTARKLGQLNEYNQISLVRNGFFEPSLSNDSGDYVLNSCLRDINAAFRLRKPAILSSHRLNYVGFINETNRDKNLRLLKSLVSKILEKWPEVEFVSSPVLAVEIAKDLRIKTAINKFGVSTF